MTTKAKTKPPKATLSVPKAAAEIGVNPATLYRWIADGHVPAFTCPGRDPGDGKRGPKGYKIFVKDWERFKRGRMVVVQAEEGGQGG